MIATFRYLNQEVLGISPPSADSTVNDDHDDLDDDSEAAQMRAELWEEPGLSPCSLVSDISNPFPL